MARVTARPKVREALDAETLVPHGPGGMFHAPLWALQTAARW